MSAPNTPAATCGVPLAGQAQHLVVERAGQCRRRGGAEAGPVAAGCVGRQRELRDDQQPTGKVLHAAVHLAGVVGKDAQSQQLVHQPGRNGRRVGRLGAHQHQQALPDGAHHGAVDLDPRLAHALQQCQHLQRVYRVVEVCLDVQRQ